MKTTCSVIRHLVGRLNRVSSRLDDICLRGRSELGMFPDDAARTRSVRRVAGQVLRTGEFWLAMTVAAIVLLAASSAVARLVSSAGELDLPTARFACLLLAMAGGAVVGNGWVRRRVPVMLRAELVRCGVPVCVGCGYSLRGACGGACAECGRPLDAHVHELLGHVGPQRDARLLRRMVLRSTLHPVGPQPHPRPLVPSPAYVTANRIPGVSGRAFARRCLEPWLSSPGFPRTYATCS